MHLLIQDVKKKRSQISVTATDNGSADATTAGKTGIPKNKKTKQATQRAEGKGERDPRCEW